MSTTSSQRGSRQKSDRQQDWPREDYYGRVSNLYYPLHSLKEGHWFKLICGASFQHLPAIRSLTLAFTLAGADCIDVAADPAVITAAQEGLQAAISLAEAAGARGFSWRGLPWLMVSFNDGEDPHFRKAEFDPTQCPPDCPRPCQSICPARAITFADRQGDFSGVIEERCYGCGRCLPVCPQQLIFTRAHVSTPGAIAPLVKQMSLDAVEIHTQVGHEQDFKRLWPAIVPHLQQLKLLAISCPDRPAVIDYLYYLYDLIQPLSCPLIWQADGRPMSGDIGLGTTHAAVKMAQKVLKASLPGYVQLAGGTNQHTLKKLRDLGLLQQQENQSAATVAGIAYGSYARSLLAPILEQLESSNCSPMPLEDRPDLLWQAVNRAHGLVSQLKSFAD